MFQMLQLVIYVIITLSIPYLGLVFINAILLINTKPAEEILSQAVKNTNFHIQSVLRKYIEPPKGRDMYSDFYTELVHQADKLNAYLIQVVILMVYNKRELTFIFGFQKIQTQMT